MTENENEQSEGQVSEVSGMDPDAPETPVAPADSTAGYPESESGEADTQGTGPDAPPPENRRDDENARSTHRRPGEHIEDENLP